MKPSLLNFIIFLATLGFGINILIDAIYDYRNPEQAKNMYPKWVGAVGGPIIIIVSLIFLLKFIWLLL